MKLEQGDNTKTHWKTRIDFPPGEGLNKKSRKYWSQVERGQGSARGYNDQSPRHQSDNRGRGRGNFQRGRGRGSRAR